ncbi:tyrosine-type recombinase/integrase [Aureimonas leprariae]|uniref:DUF4102 domain-containing protein n=1 Tax=Plantimonas leprariae TaxID=2615207 RepID=A0A7V7TUM5_9HYPH|nr:site-specific integrase [Aureimonas leprariae]KAB0676000.1 DUF4102 domain-containing protein [Aureimonas leprariae]
MPQLALTDAFVRGAKSVTGKLVEWNDTKERGLSLRVTPAGVKSWTFRYRDATGDRKRISLGRLDDVPLYDARAAAAVERAKIHTGIDPATAKRQAKTKAAAVLQAPTVAEIAERYFREAPRGRHKPNGREKRGGTLEVERYYYDRLIEPEFGKDRIGELTRSRIQSFVNDVVDEHAPTTARQCRVVLQAIFTFAVWQEDVDRNPCQFVAVPRLKARERVLTDDELRAVWIGFAEASDIEKVHVGRSVALAVMIAATTLQRRAEVTGMRKIEIDLGARTWTIPGERTKNHLTHVVPLSDLALRLIKEALQLSGNGPCVFPSPRDPERSILPTALSHAWRRLVPHLKLQAGTPTIRPHDLRRTGGTLLTSERIGIPRFVLSKVLNHISDAGGGAAVTAIYDRNAYLPEKRRALDAWAALLTEIVELQTRAANVVRISA